MSLRTLIILSLCLYTMGSTAAQDVFKDPKATLKQEFWGKLYANGGKTLYCEKDFKSKNVLITETYVYSTLWMRDYLDCGTARRCLKQHPEYGRMASDLHNIYPGEARVELDRRSSKFEDLDHTLDSDDCGNKLAYGVMEPKDDVKGDIARSILYMHVTYDLPIVGDMDQLKRWNLLDPPSPDEISRNDQIQTLQGNGNPFITNPSKARTLSSLN